MSRSRLIFWLVLPLALLLAILLPLSQRSDRIREGTLTEKTGRRGRIFDRNGVLLAADDTLSEPVTRRFTAGETLATVVGIPGLAGVEGARDSFLRPRRYFLQPTATGQDIQLTVDRKLQRRIFAALKQAVQDCRAQQGAVVVLNPADGELWALVDYPSYDPVRYKLYPPELWSSAAVSRDLEPGRICDIVRQVAGIRESTAADSLAVTQLEAEDWYRVAQRLGFGSPTGVELTDEQQGLLPTLEELTTDRQLFARVVAGKTIRITLMQLAQAVMRIAANTQSQPVLVRHIGSSFPVAGAVSRHRRRPLFDSSAADRLKSRLVQSPVGGTVPQQDGTVLIAAGLSGSGTEERVIALLIVQPLEGYYTAETAEQLFRQLGAKVAGSDD